ncbi:MAG: sensor histidine kinase [Chloroflexi bacterium]|nr:MAG: sensor histidine kinase [Chloroflexota bacterium]
MSSFKKISVNIPAGLFEQGLTEADFQAQAHILGLLVLLEQQKITPQQAIAQMGQSAVAGLRAVVCRLSEPESGDGDGFSSANPPELAAELERTRHELARIKQELSRANRVRTDFIATVSHELRTPLNSIIGFTKLLLNQKLGPLNTTQHTDLSIIYDNSKQLLSLVNDILDLSKIEAGKIRLDMDWVTVEEIIVGVIAATYILIDNKPIELKEELEPHLPRIFVDRNRIRQVVVNLLSNAAKFTDAGCITLQISKINRNGQDYVCVSVIDTGIGIRAEDIDKVFEPFRQIDSSEARRAEGTGLGMAISYRLVKLHGGDFWVESAPGRGSTFSFTIPVTPANPQQNTIDADYRLH